MERILPAPLRQIHAIGMPANAVVPARRRLAVNDESRATPAHRTTRGTDTGVPACRHLAMSRERRGAPAVEPCRKPRCRQDEERRTPPPALVSGSDDWTRKKEGPSMDPWAEPFLSTHKHARAISKDQPVPAH